MLRILQDIPTAGNAVKAFEDFQRFSTRIFHPQLSSWNLRIDRCARNSWYQKYFPKVADIINVSQTWAWASMTRQFRNFMHINILPFITIVASSFVGALCQKRFDASDEHSNFFSVINKRKIFRSVPVARVLFFAPKNVISQSFLSSNVCEGYVCAFVAPATGRYLFSLSPPFAVSYAGGSFVEIYVHKHKRLRYYLHNEKRMKKEFWNKICIWYVLFPFLSNLWF